MAGKSFGSAFKPGSALESAPFLTHGIVITGNIGSGKSSVAKMLKEQGFEVIYADKIGHEVLQMCAKKIVAEFGESVLENGEISRKKLGEIVFQNPAKRKKLEALLHPKIRLEIYKKAQILEAKNAPYFLEIPLFFEVGAKAVYNVKGVALVSAERKVSISRIMARDGLSKDLAAAKFDAQQSAESKKSQSDFVLENNGDLGALEMGVKKLMEWAGQCD